MPIPSKWWTVAGALVRYSPTARAATIGACKQPWRRYCRMVRREPEDDLLNRTRPHMLFTIGDYFAGMIIGVATTLAVRLIVWPGMDMVIAMLLGMAVGMAIQFVLGFALAPLLGMFETMLPGSLVGMYGGMLFGMRDSMAAGSRTLSSAALVGAIFGAVVVFGVKVYDWILRGAVFDASS